MPSDPIDDEARHVTNAEREEMARSLWLHKPERLWESDDVIDAIDAAVRYKRELRDAHNCLASMAAGGLTACARLRDRITALESNLAEVTRERDAALQVASTVPHSLLQATARAEAAERMADELMTERDAAEEAADALAYAIGTVEEIGEHSNLNDPWKVAIDHLESERQLSNERAEAAEKQAHDWQRASDEADHHIDRLRDRALAAERERDAVVQEREDFGNHVAEASLLHAITRKERDALKKALLLLPVVCDCGDRHAMADAHYADCPVYIRDRALAPGET